MEVILLVGHGSRDLQGNQELLEFARLMRQMAPQFEIETCFLEFAEPTIAQGIANCVQKRATRVVVVPIILFAAGHAKLHIPAAIDQAKQQYPDVRFAYGRPIGIHQNIMEILKKRLTEVGFSIHDQEGGRQPDTAVLLLGRGSSDADANSDLYKITRCLWEQVPVKWVESCFIGVTEPSFEEGLAKCMQLGAKTIYVLPYFLFTGVLINRIEKMTAGFAGLHPELRIVLGGYFGFDPQLVELLLDRVAEAVEGQAFMNCDMCRYRLEASAELEHEHTHNQEHDHHEHNDTSHAHHGLRVK